MARIGQNPNRNLEAPVKISNIVLTCVTHLPNLEDYHKDRLEVVQKCLTSMRDHAGEKYTVIIWDNGSCDEFRNWVEKEYKPDIFIKSDNVGKSVARASLFGMLDPETIVNYSDDDIYYYPDWLEPQLKLLKHFPDVACVTGYPVRVCFNWGIENTVKRLNPAIYGRFMPDDWERDYAVSVGEEPTMFIKGTSQNQDIMVKHDNVRAYATSHHCQHIGYAGTLLKAAREALKVATGTMPDEKPYDMALDQLGNRLATFDRHTRHMGNVIHDNLRYEIMKNESD